MAATRADLGCLLCDAISTDIATSAWGIAPQGGYFDIFYNLFAVSSGCDLSNCNIPSFTATDIPDITVSCAISVLEVVPQVCTQTTLNPR